MEVLSSTVKVADDRLLSTKEVAEVLGVTHGWVAQLMRQGILPSHKIGSLRKVFKSELHEWVLAQ